MLLARSMRSASVQRSRSSDSLVGEPMKQRQTLSPPSVLPPSFAGALIVFVPVVCDFSAGHPDCTAKAAQSDATEKGGRIS